MAFGNAISILLLVLASDSEDCGNRWTRQGHRAPANRVETPTSKLNLPSLDHAPAILASTTGNRCVCLAVRAPGQCYVEMPPCHASEENHWRCASGSAISSLHLLPPTVVVPDYRIGRRVGVNTGALYCQRCS